MTALPIYHCINKYKKYSCNQRVSILLIVNVALLTNKLKFVSFSIAVFIGFLIVSIIYVSRMREFPSNLSVVEFMGNI